MQKRRPKRFLRAPAAILEAIDHGQELGDCHVQVGRNHAPDAHSLGQSARQRPILDDWDALFFGIFLIC
jgi:hypothetical protein